MNRCIGPANQARLAMIEAPRQVIPPQASGEISDETIESIALAGAAAIQQLVADRNSLRNCIRAQQQDLIALTAANQELLERLRLFHRLYLEFGTRILAQLKQFDQLARETTQSTGAVASTQEDDTNLVALARRLRPDNGTGSPTNGAVS